MSELKPCPFCGEKAITKSFTTFIPGQHAMGTKYYITCTACYIDGPGMHLKEEDAIAAWNRRALHDER